MDISGQWLLVLVFALGLLFGLLFRQISGRDSGIRRLEERIDVLQKQVEGWGHSGATQSQIEEARKDLNAVQNTLVQVDRSVQNLSHFAQETLHREAQERLEKALVNLGRLEQAIEGIEKAWRDRTQIEEGHYAKTVQALQSARETLEGIRTLVTEANSNLRDGQQVIKGDLEKVQRDLAVTQENLMRVLGQVEILPGLREAVDRLEEEMGRLTTSLLGRRSGQVGEALVDEVLRPVPEGWIERNARLGDGEVEFALKLPGGYLIPLDSKFVAPEVLRDFEQNRKDEKKRQELERYLNAQVQRRAQEVAGRYLKDARVPGFGIAAVPDSVYGLCRDAIRSVAERHAIVLVPYTLLVPFVLSLYLIAQRLKLTVRVEEITQYLGFLQATLKETKRYLENMAREVRAISNLREQALERVDRVLLKLTPYVEGDILLPEGESEVS